MSRSAWGLGGLLGFELILLVFTFQLGAMEFAATALLATLALSAALWQDARGARMHWLLFVALALVTLWRGVAQLTGGVVAGILPTFLFPLGFALVAATLHRGGPASRAGVALVALGRTWFILWYFLGGNATLVAANAIGAAGAWLWLAHDTPAADGAPAEDAAPR